jgi:outer membrane receptor protein involved in Fe transport
MRIILLNLFLCLGLTLHAQKSQVVSAKILDKQTKEPVSFATVLIKNSNNGTVSNRQGAFEIVSHDTFDKILISCIGYETQEFEKENIPKEIYLTEATHLMDAIVVSAGRKRELKKNIPVAMSTVSVIEMENTKPISLDEVLNKQSGVFMVDLGNEQHMMSIRQPISTKGVYLYLEDGIPIRPTGVFNHNALLELNMAATKNIEIIRGSYSSLYGSEAIGGAVNFITANPTLIPTAEIGIRGNNYGYKRFDFKASSTVGKTGVYLGGYKSKIEKGFRDFGDYSKETFTAKVVHAFSDQLHWDTSMTYVDYYSDMSGSIGYDKFIEKEYSSDHTFTFRDAKSMRVKTALKSEWNEKNTSVFTLFYRDNSMSQNPAYRISNRTVNDSYTKGEINNNSFHSYGFIGQHNIVVNQRLNGSFGASLDYSPNTYEADKILVYRNTEGVFESYTDIGEKLSDYDADLTNSAAYFLGEYKITDALRTNFGLRFDYFNYKFTNYLGVDANSYQAPSSNNSFVALTPRLGLLYQASNNLRFYANYSRGFKPPSVGELYKGIEVPLLEPSVYTNFEIGKTFSTSDRKFYSELALYYLEGNNEVVSVKYLDEDGIDSSENRNAGETEHYGVEYLFKYQPMKEIEIRTSGSYSRHRYVDFVTNTRQDNQQSFTGNDMSGAPKWINNAEVSYQPHQIKGVRLAIEMQYISPYFTEEANEFDYGGYSFFNLRVGYRTKHVYIWSNVNNLLDTVYATRVSTAWGNTSYTPGTPQTFNIGISYSIY